MIATILLLALALASGEAASHEQTAANPVQNAGTAVGYLRADACGNVVHKDNAYRLSIQVPDAPKEISLLLRPGDGKNAVSKKLADVDGKQVIVTGEITWLPKTSQIKSDDDWTLGIILSDEQQIRVAFSPLEPALSVEAMGLLTWTEPRFRLIVRLQEKPAKELTLELWLGESKKLHGELDSLKSKAAIVASKLQWVPKGAKPDSADDYTLGLAAPIEVNSAKPKAQADQKKLTPEEAKEALLAMMRSKTGQELGWFKGNIPEEMAKLPIEKKENGWYAWTAAFHFKPSEAVYTFIVRPRPGARASVFEYKGSFMQKEGQWQATPPELVRAALQAGDK